MTDHPKISIVIATFNSGKTLPRVLKSISDQDYPSRKMEIFIIDGGSADETLDVARKYGCKIVNNPKVDQVYAKHTGYLIARGSYMLLLDSDEVLESNKSVRQKVETMLKDSRIKAVISSGLKKPKDYPQINYYLNEFGDPFSYFMYRNSKEPKFFLNELKCSYKTVYEDRDKMVFDFSGLSEPPFIELTAMAVMVDLKYAKSAFPVLTKNIPAHTHLFYFLNSKKNLFAVMKHDVVLHYSVPTLKGYLRKIRSRVKSNIYGTSMGLAGFKGRERYHSFGYKIKKFMFIPYSFSLILPFLDSVYLSVSRGRLIYLIHPFLCLYTLLLIIFYYILSLFGTKIKLYGYGS